MLDAPSIAIDLPLKILIWEDSQGKVWVSYNRVPAYFTSRMAYRRSCYRTSLLWETWQRRPQSNS